MLTDLQRLDYAEAMMKIPKADHEAYLHEKAVTETTDIDVINQLTVELADNAVAEASLADIPQTDACDPVTARPLQPVGPETTEPTAMA